MHRYYSNWICLLAEPSVPPRNNNTYYIDEMESVFLVRNIFQDFFFHVDIHHVYTYNARRKICKIHRRASEMGSMRWCNERRAFGHVGWQVGRLFRNPTNRYCYCMCVAAATCCIQPAAKICNSLCPPSYNSRYLLNLIRQ